MSLSRWKGGTRRCVLRVMLLTILVLLVVTSTGFGAAKIVFKASHTGAPKATAGKALDFMARLIQERSGGRVKMEVYHSGVLSGGSGTTLVDQVRSGAIEMQVGTQLLFASLDPRWMLLNLPFLFDSAGEAQMFYTGSPIVEQLLEATEKHGLTSVAIWGRDLRQIANSKRRVRTVQDAAGLKLRVPETKLWMAFFKEIGVTATPMPFGEVYTALQLKTVDGQENAMDNMLENRFHEVQKYLTLIDYTTDSLVVSFNTAFWKSLAEADRNLIAKAAKDAGVYKFSIDAADNRRALVEMMKAGIVVDALTDDEREAFKEKAKKVWQDYEKVVGKDLIRQTLLELGKDPDWYNK
ncbi:MAG: TRAP transporter substrate-binding protein [Bacillota bacterium]